MAESYRGRRVVIIGGIGFIGSNLALRLVEDGADILLIDSMNPNYGGNMRNIAPLLGRVAVNISDIRDPHSLPWLLDGAQVIFNLAGQTSHLDSMRDPFTDLDINARAQLSLLEVARTACPKARIIFASTRQIYGRPHYLPVDEAHPLQPVDVNGINKISGEFYHRLYHDVHGIHTVVLRLTNTYGPRMRIRDDRQTFLGVWVRNALTGRPVEVWGGTQRRDYNHVDDVVEALWCAGLGDGLAGGVFNIGHDEIWSLRETAALLADLQPDTDIRIEDFPAERKKIDIGDYYSSFARFSAATGWRPRIGLRAGLAGTLAYYRAELPEYADSP